jgi:hypothetical protein
VARDSRKLVAYCGLYCGDCHGYKGIIPDMARDLRKELRRSKYAKFAKGVSKFFKVLEKYETCYEVLGAMVRFRCRKGCRNGGGPPFCKIRQCCQKKGYEGCWECDDFEACKKLDFLRSVHDDGHIKNLKIIRKRGVPAFIKGKRHW